MLCAKCVCYGSQRSSLPQHFSGCPFFAVSHGGNHLLIYIWIQLLAHTISLKFNNSTYKLDFSCNFINLLIKSSVWPLNQTVSTVSQALLLMRESVICHFGHNSNSRVLALFISYSKIRFILIYLPFCHSSQKWVDFVLFNVLPFRFLGLMWPSVWIWRGFKSNGWGWKVGGHEGGERHQLGKCCLHI